MRYIRFSICGFLMILVYSLVLPAIVEIPVGLLFGMIMLFTKNRFKIRLSFGLLLVTLFSASYFVLDSFNGYSTPRAVAFGLTIVFLYLFGMNWGTTLDVDLYKKYALFALRVISYGLTFYILACMVYTILHGYEINALNRSPYQVWNGVKGTATHFATMSAPPIAVSCLDVLIKKGRERIAATAILVLLLISNMMMANRIIFIFFAVFMGLSAIIVYKDQGIDKKAKFILLGSILIILLYTTYELDLFSIKSLLSRFAVFRRIQTLDALGYEDPRLERQLYVITNFFKHTKGGGFFFTEVGEVHNVWLDVYDYAGMLPFLMFVFFTFSVIKHMLKCFKATSQDTVAAYLIVVLFSYMISFAEEPVIRASEPYFVLFFFVCGLVCTYKNSV